MTTLAIPRFKNSTLGLNIAYYCLNSEAPQISVVLISIYYIAFPSIIFPKVIGDPLLCHGSHGKVTKELLGD